MFYIRKAEKRDIVQVIEIEKVSFENPWSENAFLCELSKSKLNKNIFLVAIENNTENVIGYIIGDKVIDFAAIYNIAVRKDWRKKGIGFALLKEFENNIIKEDYSSITLEVRESNKAAINLYKKFGFEIKGRREKYYEGKEDALLMWKYLK